MARCVCLCSEELREWVLEHTLLSDGGTMKGCNCAIYVLCDSGKGHDAEETMEE